MSNLEEKDRNMKEKNNSKSKITKIKELEKSSKGITLIALVITIVVLLILAGVSIAMLTGDNGILTRAGDAKIETALGAVKEQIGLYQIEKKMDNKEVTPENLLVEGKVSRTVQAGEADKYYMYYALKENSFEGMQGLGKGNIARTAESLLAEGKVSRTVQLGEADKYYMYYALKENSFEGMQGLGKGNIASLKDVFLIDDNLNVKYISSNGKEYGDNLNNKVLDDETEIRFSSKAFSEYVSKISGVTEDEMKFKWMKDQTRLEINGSNIDSLQDLIFFPNLKELRLDNVKLRDLQGIENCEKIKSLLIYTSSIENYSQLSKLTNIEVIDIAGGTQKFDQIIDAIKNLTNIKILTLRSIGITNMSKIEEIKGLIELSLSGNKIEKIEGLESMQELQRLDLSNNKISDIIPLKYNTKLLDLNLKGNINIDGNKENYTGERLKDLNEIGKIFDRGGNIQVDIEQLKLFNGYKRLDVSNRNLSTLEILDGITTLEFLSLDNNNITLEDQKSKEILKNMKNLNTIYLTDNKITDISILNNLINLRRLRITGEENKIDLSQIQDMLPNLELHISGKQLETVNFCTNKEKITKLTTYGLDNMPDISSLNNLKHIDIIESRIKDYSNLTKITSLETLYMYSSNLHEKRIEFSKLPNIKILNLSHNFLNDQDIQLLLANMENHINLNINLSNNSIINANTLLELDSSCKIDVSGNVNLSQEAKDKLKTKFGNNVTF